MVQFDCKWGQNSNCRLKSDECLTQDQNRKPKKSCVT